MKYIKGTAEQSINGRQPYAIMRRFANYYKKHHQLEYYTSTNSSVTVYCPSTGFARQIIKASGIDQELLIKLI